MRRGSPQAAFDSLPSTRITPNKEQEMGAEKPEPESCAELSLSFCAHKMGIKHLPQKSEG